ncbi:MAG: hydrolase [Acidothermales bacterium]|nr:hydrolase [Acidothermales bacterium]
MRDDAAVTVAVCQLAPVLGDVEGNVARALAAVAGAAAAGARLVVLPELVSSGYAFSGPDELARCAEPPGGPTVTRLAAAARAHGAVVVAGFPELADGGEMCNSAVLADPSGVRAVYRKAHLWDREKALFTAGSAPPAVVDTGVGRVGVMVCYDLRFPEWLRLATLDGAEIVCAPANWPAEPRTAGERPVEVVRLQASASVNHVYVAAADRVGRERGVDWVGGSAIVAPDGYPLAVADPARGEQLLTAECRPAAARDKRVSPHNDVLADRRLDLYG